MDYDPTKWENDPHLTAEDLQITDESFKSWRDLGVDPRDIKNPVDAKKYREWLAAHAK